MAVSTCTFRINFINQLEEFDIFQCDQEHLEGKNLCLFHDEDYLKDDINHKNKDIVIGKLNGRIDESNANNKPLYCIGYYLPDIIIDQDFKQPVWFIRCKFQRADFSEITFASAYFSGTTFASKTTFSEITFADIAEFSHTTFSSKAHFRCKFQGRTYFDYTTFKKPNEIRFEIMDMSQVSFMNADITGIRFSGKTRWSEYGQFKIVEEKELEEILSKNRDTEESEAKDIKKKGTKL